MQKPANYQPIGDYGIIGDLRTIALVSNKGSIDFMCFPNFDSPSIFAALLDREKGGFFQISPVQENINRKQMYYPDTNILLTRFLFEEGIGEITDFMPVSNFCDKNMIMRKVLNIKGKITYRMQCCPRFNYARNLHQVRPGKNSLIFTSKGKDGISLKLTSSIPLKIKGNDGYAEFTLDIGEKAEFILENMSENASYSDMPNFLERSFEQTLEYWKKWTAKSTYNGRWKEMVTRSALVLKLLISSQNGSIVAAPTFGLPEKIGGSKNWDYRFGWIRDTAFTIYSLMRIGYKDEAEAFMKWIEKICANLDSSSVLKPVYSLDGKKVLSEKTLGDFEGYMNSYPVRIGNKAADQLQLDVCGEFIDSIYLCDTHISPISRDIWLTLSGQVNWIRKNWKKKDSSIWETRGDPEKYLYSRFMCWVALDRAIKIGTRRSFPFPATWLKTRNEIYHSVYRNFWNSKLKSFIQFEKGVELDASALLMPLMRFISPNDSQWLSTLRSLEKDLIVDCLVYRYRPEEATKFGLSKGEGTFSACSFWYIECLSRAGKLKEAQLYFDKMLSYANPLGLYSEQLGSKGELLGNFPQALSHLSLISAAYDLNKRLEK